MPETDAPTQLERVVGEVAQSGPAEIDVRAQRGQAFAYLIEKLEPTDLGRRLGLDRLSNFNDLRSTVPIFRADAHLVKIEAALGFGPALGAGSAGNDPGTAEREETVGRWWAWLRQHRRPHPQRCFRLGVESDPAVASWEEADLRALMGREGKLEIARVQDAGACIEAMKRFETDLLVVPSLASVAWLEAHGRARLEHLVPSLRAIMAQHDLEEAVRSRLPVLAQGILHPGGRLSLPPRVGHDEPHLGRLAWSSCLIELLREDESGGVGSRRDERQAVLPEHAIMGERYELVISSGAGFLRMRSGIFVRIVGFDRLRDGTRLVPVPIFAPLAPPPSTLALEGVRVPGSTLTSALRQAFEREDPALVAAEIGGAQRDDMRNSGRMRPTDSGFFEATELGALDPDRKGQRPLGLELRVEVQGRSRDDFSTRLAARFDAIVRRRNPAYDYLRGRGDLVAPVVVILAAGSERRARQQRASSFRGTVARPQIRIAANPG